ncbi:hypothetical protein NQ315_008907 [Exocentrus adspersus]|uniref:Uncharacterized protein n=1 Tax=Exocentrus adspersus TaxID=1586481 RepID=A0AAV8V6U6_9CUCU|nr:hypothetical protein NQ315_008907 [Exocentrus adspersus]
MLAKNVEREIRATILPTNIAIEHSYNIVLPWYGNSWEIALRRFYLLEKRLLTQPLRENYSRVMRDYMEQGRMTLVDTKENFAENSFYIPHFAVVKESVATPHRIVESSSIVL